MTKKKAPKKVPKKAPKKKGVVSKIKDKLRGKKGKAKDKAEEVVKKIAKRVKQKPITAAVLIEELAPTINAKLNAGQPIDERVDVTDIVKGFCAVKKIR